MEGGECAGSCDGDCTGYCETRIEGSCSGECYGECALTYTPAECNGHCQGSCEGHCEGSCEGTVRPPSVDADCQAQVEARVEASVECEPAQVTWGVDTSGMENIAELTYHMGRGDYLTTMNSSAEAIFNGEADLSSTQLACAIKQLPAAIAILNDASATLVWVVEVESTILFP
jgi:hypothetical protein